MALITRCPVCGTQFKVVPDQLRISEGWVRCGQCAEVFDASSDLQQGEMAMPGTAVLGAAVAPVLDAAPVESVAVDADLPHAPYLNPTEPESFTNYLNQASVSSVLPVQEDVLPEEPEEGPAAPLLPPDIEAAGGQASDVFPVVDQVDVNAVPEAELEAEPEDAPELEEQPLSSPVLFAPEPSAESLAANYSFARAPTPPSDGQTRFVRWGTLLGVGLLGLLLGLQVLLYGRDRIVASWSVTKPWFQSACGLLGCEVLALRHIESIAIDSSSLSVTRNDAYHLSLVLKNHAMVDLAMPALEFVLTDGDEQALFRRVLSPSDFGGASRLLFAGREWATSVDVQVLDNAMKSRIVGYRLLAFYP